MTIVNVPTKTSDSIGGVLTNTRTPGPNDLSAVNVEKIKDALIEQAEAINDGHADVSAISAVLATKADKSVTISAGTGLTGGGDLSANRSFQVDIAGTNPQPIGTAGAPGASGKVSDRDHVHAHGAQTDQSLHALATKTAHGFLAALDFDRVLAKAQKLVTFWRTDLGEPFATFLASSLSGTGSGINQTATGHGSIVLVNPGTTSTGAATVRSTTNYAYLQSGNYSNGFVMEVLGGIFDELPDGSDDYTVFVCGVTSSDFVTTRVGFEYDPAVSANWQAIYTSGGVTTRTNTGVAAVGSITINNYTRFRIEYTPGASGPVTFYINGVQVAQLTSGLPATVAAGYYVPVRIVKTLGTNLRRFLLDFTELVQIPLSGERA